MTPDEIDAYESDLELALYRGYRDVNVEELDHDDADHLASFLEG